MQRGKKSLIIRLMVAFCLVFAMGAFVVLAGCAGSCGGSTAATYSVTYNYDQTESTVTGSDEATEGESFSFTAQAKTDYKLTSVTATVGGEDVELDQSGNTYTIAGESVTGDIVVTVDAEALPVTTYTVEYADVTGATVEGAESVEEGASLTFTVTAETGYEISSVTATVGGESVTPASSGNEYTIANVTGNVVVTVVASKISYTVTANAQNASVDVAESVLHGEDLTFTVTTENGYEISSVTATVGGENASVTNEGNKYTVSDVTGDVVITVNAAQKTYNVEIDATNATVNGVTDGQKVNHGAEISFTVSATDGYEIVLVDAKMAGKDIEVVMDGDTYSIPNVTGDVIIIVTTKLIEYTVDVNATNATVNGITDGQEIAYGEDLTFTVNANTGYENVKVSATVGGEDVTPSNEGNSYTISNITGDVVITVTASQIVYDVTVNAENATVTVDESIAYGETLEFTVKAEEGYTVTKVTVNDEEVTAGSDGTYAVKNITSDVTIVVTTEIKSYTVSVAENDHAQVNFVGETTVQHGGQVQFTVTVDNGYVLNRVYLNNNVSNVLTPDGEGLYTISNITSDTVIHIGLNRETYSVSFNEGAFEVSGDPTVAFEGNYTFGVVANEGYNIASVTAVMGGEPVLVTDNEDGSYTIANVTGNIEVTITCQVITFGVEYNYDEEQVTVEGADSVDYNGELTFTVTAKPGYNIISVSATVGGSTITVSNNGNEYTISISGATVTGDIVITVSSENSNIEGDATYTINYNEVTYSNYEQNAPRLIESVEYTIENYGEFSIKELANETYYNFLGWATSVDGDVVDLTTEDIYEALVSGENNTIELYAVWGFNQDKVAEIVSILPVEMGLSKTYTGFRAVINFYGSEDWQQLKSEMNRHGDYTEYFGAILTTKNDGGLADEVIAEHLQEMGMYDADTASNTVIYSENNSYLYGALNQNESRLEAFANPAYGWNSTAIQAENYYLKCWVALNIGGNYVVIQQENLTWAASLYVESDATYTINYNEVTYSNYEQNAPRLIESVEYTIENYGEFSIKELANETYYNFLGWATSVDGDVVDLTTEDIYEALVSGENNTIELYAVWGFNQDKVAEIVSILPVEMGLSKTYTGFRAVINFYGSEDWQQLKSEMNRHGDYTEYFGAILTTKNDGGLADEVIAEHLQEMGMYDADTASNTVIYSENNSYLYGALNQNESRLEAFANPAYGWNSTAVQAENYYLKCWVALNIGGNYVIIQQENLTWAASLYSVS